MPELLTIDIHAHVVVPAATALIGANLDPARDPFMRFGGPSTPYNDSLGPQLIPLLTEPRLRLAEMDREGVRYQAVSIAPPHYFYYLEAELGAAVARVQNDAIGALVEDHPDRLVGLATLPMQAPEQALAEFERIMAMRAFRGVSINPNAEGRDYDEPEYEPFWRRAEELGAVVVLHPNGYPNGERLTRYYMINVVGNPMETTVALSHLVLGGVIERHPEVRIVAVHGGGYLPFYMDRMDHAFECRPEIQASIKQAPSISLKRLYFDSIVFGDGLDYLVDRVGADHVVLGTDYPFDMGEKDPVGRIGRVVNASPEDKDLMLGRTAARLLRIDP